MTEIKASNYATGDIGVEFIEAPLEEVEEFLAATLKFVAADGIAALGQYSRYGILRDNAAQIDQVFGGSDYDYRTGEYFREDPDRYTISGYCRISRICMNPGFVMIEGPSSTSLTEAQCLAAFSGRYAVSIQIRNNGSGSCVGVGSGVPEDCTFCITDFRGRPPPPPGQLCHPDHARRIACYHEENRRSQFLAQGQPLWFEEIAHYKKRRVRDRFNREIIYEYLKCWSSPGLMDTFSLMKESVFHAKNEEPVPHGI